jgi:hypothetical protein
LTNTGGIVNTTYKFDMFGTLLAGPAWATPLFFAVR